MLGCRVMSINPSNSEMPQAGVRLMSHPVVCRAGFTETMPEIMGPATINTLKELTSEGVWSWTSRPLDWHLNDVLKQGRVGGRSTNGPAKSVVLTTNNREIPRETLSVREYSE